MNKPHNCPPADEILAWMDGETTPGTSFLEHIKECPHCQLLKSTITGENLLLGTLLDCVPPVPDLSTRVMERIGPGRPQEYRLHLVAAFALLPAFLLGATQLAKMLSVFLTPYWPAGSLAWLSFAGSLFWKLYSAGRLVMESAREGGTLQAAVIFTLLSFAIPYLQKRRRLENV